MLHLLVPALHLTGSHYAYDSICVIAYLEVKVQNTLRACTWWHVGDEMWEWSGGSMLQHFCKQTHQLIETDQYLRGLGTNRSNGENDIDWKTMQWVSVQCKTLRGPYAVEFSYWIWIDGPPKVTIRVLTRTPRFSCLVLNIQCRVGPLF